MNARILKTSFLLVITALFCAHAQALPNEWEALRELVPGAKASVLQKKLGKPAEKKGKRWVYKVPSLDRVEVKVEKDKVLSTRGYFKKPKPFAELFSADDSFVLDSRREAPDSNWTTNFLQQPEKGWIWQLNADGAIVSFQVEAPWDSKQVRVTHAQAMKKIEEEAKP